MTIGDNFNDVEMLGMLDWCSNEMHQQTLRLLPSGWLPGLSKMGQRRQ